MSTNTFPEQRLDGTFSERRLGGSRIAAALAWLGGGQWRELGERHERSSVTIAGVVVLFGAVLAWLVATLAVAGSTRWPVPAILPFTLVFGVLVGAVTRAIASGPIHGWFGVLARGVVAVTVGAVVGELAALAMFAGAIDRRLDEQAAHTADSTPAAAQATADLDQARQARTGLDATVEQARARRDEALVTARCEYNPTPGCPQTRITGVPGAGPETRTANELLADAQRELDGAKATRDRQVPALDSKIAEAERTVAGARKAAVANVDHGLGARWVAMHDYTVRSSAALMLRLSAIAFFTLLSVLPLILRLWRGETTHDRDAAARAERQRAELAADTAIAVKRAEVRAAAEIMWADQQLASARLAVEAQTEIDRAQYRRRVIEALEGAVDKPPPLQAVEEDMYLPIAAEAKAAGRAAAKLPAGKKDAGETENLPARVESGDEPRASLIPSVPDVTKAAARWIRPLVPTLVARAIDSATQPLRGARQVFEEVEEINFSLKRTRRVTVHSEHPDDHPERPRQVRSASADTRIDPRPVESHRDHGDHGRHGPANAAAERRSSDRPSLDRAAPQPPSLGRGARQAELTDRDGPDELPGPDGPHQLPPAE